jgi:hypothetical protein
MAANISDNPSASSPEERASNVDKCTGEDRKLESPGMGRN